MNIKEFLEKQRLQIINKKKLTISGEINILASDFGESILMNDELFYSIEKHADQLNKEYPYIEVETVRELHEITIKLFAYNKSFIQLDFINIFNYSLEELLQKINELGRLIFRLNVYGEISTLEKIEKFIFVNNDIEVFGKIVNTKTKGELSVATGKIVRKILDRDNKV